MCEQADAMRAVREAAECLSAACRARREPLLDGLRSVYGVAVEEPIPEALSSLLKRLGSNNQPH